MDCLHKEWFAMKPIKIKHNTWLSPEEVTSEDGKEFYKKDNPS